MKYFLKLRSYGFNRAVVFLVLRSLQLVRCLYYRFLFSDNKPSLFNVKLNQPVQFSGRGEIVMHDVVVGVWPSPGFLSGYAYFEARNPGSNIRVGSGTLFNNGATLIADKGSICIGNRCLIGQNFFVADSDFHGLSLENRNNGIYECFDVEVGDDVFIGGDVKILKGVKVGRGAVIGTGSLVVHDVPSMTIYAGVPAKLVRHL